MFSRASFLKIEFNIDEPVKSRFDHSMFLVALFNQGSGLDKKLKDPVPEKFLEQDQ